MSWMDDGGFEMQAFPAWDGRPMARMSFRTSTGQTYFNLTKTEVQRIRRISIHALREESDCSRMTLCSKHGYFNPRSP